MDVTSAEIAREAEAVFGTPSLAAAWLDRPSKLLAGRTPRQAVTEPEGRAQVLRQLQWFSGNAGRNSYDQSLVEVLNDPMINLVLQRAGSGPEDLLTLCENASERKRAA